jgi:hypothetical protein
MDFVAWPCVCLLPPSPVDDPFRHQQQIVGDEQLGVIGPDGYIEHPLGYLPANGLSATNRLKHRLLSFSAEGSQEPSGGMDC